MKNGSIFYYVRYVTLINQQIEQNFDWKPANELKMIALVHKMKARFGLDTLKNTFDDS